MLITDVRAASTRHEWRRPIGDVNGVSPTTSTVLDLVLVTTDTGLTGVGVGGHVDLDRVAAAVLGEDPRAVTALYDRMLAAAFKFGHHGGVAASIGAIDQALWDIKAQAAGEPLWRLLGGRDRFVPGYASALEAGLDDESAAVVWRGFAERGFTAGKIKGGRDVERDARRLAALRDILAVNTAEPALMIDANESWHRSQAVRHVVRLEQQLDLTWVEEPVRRWDVEGLRHVRQGIRAAVATGENLTGLDEFRALLAGGAVDVVQVGCGWGITHFLRVAHLAHAHDLPVSPVGFTPALAPAAAAVPNLLTIEVQDLRHPEHLTVDQSIERGGIVLGDRPGSGMRFDPAPTDPPPTTVPPGTGPHLRPSRAGLRMTPEDE